MIGGNNGTTAVYRGVQARDSKGTYGNLLPTRLAMKDLDISPSILARWAREFEGKASKVAHGPYEFISFEKFGRMRHELA